MRTRIRIEREEAQMHQWTVGVLGVVAAWGPC